MTWILVQYLWQLYHLRMVFSISHFCSSLGAASHVVLRLLAILMLLPTFIRLIQLLVFATVQVRGKLLIQLFAIFYQLLNAIALEVRALNLLWFALHVDVMEAACLRWR